ncbi:hypothetical protein JS528_11300 [Bifidobacterium sp. MA2]|uniref:Uncharacterized protein n=1 Tax=Bifidobacterium santillanense TaxID=2809028 RepID=A0ABS5UT14_9BIFI|nr:hypothetical protein [Bifidobacterium santillanense]MBT1173903.1 hypothetical protein [Bifidobacterium santillanense]
MTAPFRSTSGSAPAEADDCRPYPFGCGGRGTVVDGTCRRCGAHRSPTQPDSPDDAGDPPDSHRAAGALRRMLSGEPLEGVICATPEQRDGGAAFGVADVALHLCYMILMMPVRIGLFVLLMIPRALRVISPAALRFGSTNALGLGLFTSLGNRPVPETLIRVRLPDGTERILLLRGEIRGGMPTLGHPITAQVRPRRDGTLRTRRLYDRANHVSIRCATPAPLFWNRLAMIGLIAMYLAIVGSLTGGFGLWD